ncbi:52 kDa repressor of the inhibitor of the protein kinase-like [Aphis craccivora]|uniref:52 kDa repressor of the inhibitor of the protein kinase-like n=1 Tax=Aphis craccivora TaxID=307492 RepID=A0A6G0YYE6_APHCR|nr:52 kDa repressor of the inhibitor of the protein kinase-like [Aphis craccivora]
MPLLPGDCVQGQSHPIWPISHSVYSLSSLRRLKNYLRSTMGQERLNGLAVLNIHKNIPINIDEVINIFSRSSRRIKTEDWSI